MSNLNSNKKSNNDETQINQINQIRQFICDLDKLILDAYKSCRSMSDALLMKQNIEILKSKWEKVYDCTKEANNIL